MYETRKGLEPRAPTHRKGLPAATLHDLLVWPDPLTVSLCKAQAILLWFYIWG